MFTRLAHVVDQLSHLGLLVSTALVAYIMSTQTLEVLLRSFGRPTTWVYDLNLVAIAGVVFLGLAGAEKDGRNISVDILTARLKGRSSLVLRIINAGFALLMLGLLAVFGVVVALESIEQGRTTGGLFRVPQAIPELSLPIGAVLMALQIIVDLGRAIRRDEPPRAEPPT